VIPCAMAPGAGAAAGAVTFGAAAAATMLTAPVTAGTALAAAG
jgi:hypothetical protein